MNKRNRTKPFKEINLKKCMACKNNLFNLNVLFDEHYKF